MDILEYDGKLWEVTLLSPASEEPLQLECTKLTPDGGLQFVMWRDDTGQFVMKSYAELVPVRVVSLVEEFATRML